MNAKALLSLTNVAVFGLLFAGCDTAPRDSDLDRNTVDRAAVQDCLAELDQCFEQIDGFDPEAFEACHEQVNVCFENADRPGGDDGGRPDGDDGGRPDGDDGGRPDGDDGGEQSCSLQVSSSVSGPDGSTDYTVDCSKEAGTGVIECSCEVNGGEPSPLSVSTDNDQCGFTPDEIMAVGDACVAQAD